MKIVVVDDEALLVKGIRFNLQNEGYQVLTGTNGLEAVELAKDPEIALMILDVMMPEMDGLTACTKIREFSQVPNPGFELQNVKRLCQIVICAMVKAH